LYLIVAAVAALVVVVVGVVFYVQHENAIVLKRSKTEIYESFCMFFHISNDQNQQQIQVQKTVNCWMREW